MTDPISLTAGIVGLTTFAIQSSKILYDAIDNVKNGGRNLRELKDETGALASVLTSLSETISVSEEDFTALQTPLRNCGKLCQASAILLRDCSSRAEDGKFSWRGFLNSTYKGKDILELRSLIGAYKSTIAIALADANIRQVRITAKVLQDYKDMIEETTSDLHELLQRCSSSSLDSPRTENAIIQPSEISDPEMAEERASIEACLAVCAKVSEHIDEAQKEFEQSDSNNRKQGRIVVVTKSTPAGQITSQRLEDCKTEIDLTSEELRVRLKELNHRVTKLSRQTRNGTGSHAGSENAAKISEEIDSINQCLSVCQEATEHVTKERINVYEDIHIVDDGDQILVSTIGDLISAKHFKAGSRSMQVFGQMSDASYQHTLDTIAVRRGKAEASAKKGDENDKKPTQPSDSRFSGQWGAGRKLK